MKQKTFTNIREYPRSFGERFKETYSNCPTGSIVALCPCGNTFHKKEWDKQKFCSTVCVLRYGNQKPQIFSEIKEAFAPAS